MKRQAKSAIRTSTGSKVFDVCNILILTLLSLVCIYPVWYVLMASFSDSSLLMQHTARGLQHGCLQGCTQKPHDPVRLSEYLEDLDDRAAHEYCDDVPGSVFFIQEGRALEEADHDPDHRDHVHIGRHDPLLSDTAGFPSDRHPLGTDPSLYDQHVQYDHFADLF